MRAKQFIIEAPATVQNKLNVITTKLSTGQVTDPKTIDYIYKILNKPEIQQTVSTFLSRVVATDQDVASFQEKNNQALVDIIRKLPVPKEKLDQFLKRWASGKGFVNTELLVSGSKGTLQQLIPDPIAFIAFEKFEKMRSMYSMPKKGTTGYGEFGLSMLSPFVMLKAPGDIEVNGEPVEVKGNDARLYADERTPVSEAPIVAKGSSAAPVPPGIQNQQKSLAGSKIPMGQPPAAAPAKVKRGSEPGSLNNVIASLQDPNTAPATAQQLTQAFADRGIDATKLVKSLQKQDATTALETLKVEWWRAGFNAYQRAIGMPIMVIGFGQFLVSDKAEDFIDWGCLPRSITNYGYMFGRKAGQSRETYPKIFVPGHNK
jgi:hypothetical protein